MARACPRKRRGGEAADLDRIPAGILGPHRAKVLPFQPHWFHAYPRDLQICVIGPRLLALVVEEICHETSAASSSTIRHIFERSPPAA